MVGTIGTLASDLAITRRKPVFLTMDQHLPAHHSFFSGRRAQLIALICVFLVVSAKAVCETAVTTQRYDNARTGQNLSETLLNTSNVNAASFGKLFTRAVDDEVYAQPLYVPNVAVPNVGLRNVLFIATVNNSIYAFDADDPGAVEPLWHISLTGSEPGARPVTARDVGHKCGIYRDYGGNIGIVGTPVVDPATSTLYVVARTKRSSPPTEPITRRIYVAVRAMRRAARSMEKEEFSHQFQGYIGDAQRPLIYAATGTLWLIARRLENVALAVERVDFLQHLHAIDIATGSPRPGSPVIIKARVAGSGAGSSNGGLNFDPIIHNQRGSLLFANNRVYITWASHCETGPHHGWIMGYDPSTLRQVVATTVTPDGVGGGIWQSNSGPSADEHGYIYLTTGNGTATAQRGGETTETPF